MSTANELRLTTEIISPANTAVYTVGDKTYRMEDSPVEHLSFTDSSETESSE